MIDNFLGIDTDVGGGGVMILRTGQVSSTS